MNHSTAIKSMVIEKVAQLTKKTLMRHSSTSSFIIFAALVSFALLGCDKQTDSQNAAERPGAASGAASTVAPGVASAAEPEHAPPGAKPGSHEDWCGGHQVPESLCTRCNPALISAFKATGDWCAQHGLPESQCLICDPDLKIERPPKTEEASP